MMRGRDIRFVLAVAAALALPSPSAQAQQRTVNFYNWSNYMAPGVLEDFTKETGIKVVYDTFDANETLETRLLAGKSGYDLVVPTAYFLQRQIKANIFQKLDKSKLPNLANAWPVVTRQLAIYDPGNQYAANYMWGTTGINSTKQADLEKAADLVIKIRPYVRKFHSSEYLSALATGEICFVVGWSGDIMQARSRAAEAKSDVEIGYSIPKEGAQLFFDNLAIPADAKNVAEAYELINYLYRPEIAARNSNFLSYANGNLASQTLIDPKIFNDRGIYPDEAMQQKLFVITARDPATQRVMNRLWLKVKTGR
jgi:putrescine transport system substrate-binding protein